MENFLLCLIPLFAAVDPLGLIPVFVTVTQDLTPAQRRRVVARAVPSALLIAALFITLGRPLLRFLGLDVADLQIAGGALLFIYAMLDLALPGKPMTSTLQKGDDPGLTIGVVPLATPLIAGPAVLSLGLVLGDHYGLPLTLAALVVNLALLAVLLASVDHLLRFIPMPAMRAASKVVDLLLAAIGVGIVRQGIEAILHGTGAG